VQFAGIQAFSDFLLERGGKNETAMLWPRRTCPFGLPDDAEDIDNIVLYSIGHVLRATAVDIANAPLPPQFVSLLCQLEQREKRNAWVSRRARVPQPRALIREPVNEVAQHGAAEPQPIPTATGVDLPAIA